MPMWTTLPHLRRLAASASLHVDRTVTFHHRCMVTLSLDRTINSHHRCMVTLNLDRTINFHRRCMMTLNPPRKKCGFCEHMRLSIGDPAESAWFVPHQKHLAVLGVSFYTVGCQAIKFYSGTVQCWLDRIKR